ncbi:MAG: single-stranded-DNA-specific exonuclease RecJ [Solirubrobacterales bacterium]|nr:single-stranded-DNA-specific exonuclease RecJ [Solirubrobacterales bacterium]
MASAAQASAFTLNPYEYGEARAIATELDLAEPVAVTLVRRGHRTVEDAREFLDGREEHDPLLFNGMAEARDLLLEAAEAGRQITIHGDYDVDGVCSTAILVGALREAGASCDWLIPDRMADGYGLSRGGVEALASRGTEVLVTVDCGIACAEEVALAQGKGMQVIVSDHHIAPERLPECTILHPVISGYPFEELCGTGVAHKLATALRLALGVKGAGERDLDLAALATVADMVPLRGENRRIVRQGLAAMRTGARPGLRALMAASATDQAVVDAGDLSFRLAPRINAAGRLYRADAGVELMLTEDTDRAAAIAAELDRANHERRDTERGVLGAAESARGELPEELRDAPALVLAGEGWHRGVVGIVASRLVERHWRPVVLIGLDGAVGRGSGRSIPGIDLVEALDACSEHLVRHGGHAAAAGLEIEADKVDEFRAAFVERVAARLDPEAMVKTERIDALIGVGTGGIGLDLAEQIERLGPFGMGNPDPRLVVPSARLRSVRPLGQSGKHSRFELESGTGRANGVAFGINGKVSSREGEAIDAGVRLEVDRWNGAEAPRIVLRELYLAEQPEAGHQQEGEPEAQPGCPDRREDWWRRLEAELERAPGTLPEELVAASAQAGASAREVVDRRGGAAVAAIAELVSSGDSVLALCADASVRRELAERAADPRRFGGEAALVACARCGPEHLDQALGASGDSGPAPPGLVLADWGSLAQRPLAARRFEHVVLVDPPPAEELGRAAGLARAGEGAASAPFAAGFLHPAWGGAELELAEKLAMAEWQLRPAITEIYRALRDAGGVASGDGLPALLAGEGRYPRSPEVAGRCLRVLTELGLCEWTLDPANRSLGSVSSERTELERSEAYLAYRARHEEIRTFLQGQTRRP